MIFNFNLALKTALKSLSQIGFPQSTHDRKFLYKDLLRECAQESGSEKSRTGQGKKAKQRCGLSWKVVRTHSLEVLGKF